MRFLVCSSVQVRNRALILPLWILVSRTDSNSNQISTQTLRQVPGKEEKDRSQDSRPEDHRIIGCTSWDLRISLVELMSVPASNKRTWEFEDNEDQPYLCRDTLHILACKPLPASSFTTSPNRSPMISSDSVESACAIQTWTKSSKRIAYHFRVVAPHKTTHPCDVLGLPQRTIFSIMFFQGDLCIPRCNTYAYRKESRPGRKNERSGGGILPSHCNLNLSHKNLQGGHVLSYLAHKSVPHIGNEASFLHFFPPSEEGGVHEAPGECQNRLQCCPQTCHKRTGKSTSAGFPLTPEVPLEVTESNLTGSFQVSRWPSHQWASPKRLQRTPQSLAKPKVIKKDHRTAACSVVVCHDRVWRHGNKTENSMIDDDLSLLEVPGSYADFLQMNYELFASSHHHFDYSFCEICMSDLRRRSYRETV